MEFYDYMQNVFNGFAALNSPYYLSELDMILYG